MSRAVIAVALWVATQAWWPVHAQSVVEFAATSGTVIPPLVATNGCVLLPSVAGIENGGRATYTFEVANRGEYVVQALVQVPGPEGNSVCINIDGEPSDPEMRWEIPVPNPSSTNAFWMNVSSRGKVRTFSLEAGRHQLAVSGCEPELRLHRFRVAVPPAPPGRLRVVTR